VPHEQPDVLASPGHLQPVVVVKQHMP
jgi:hypothetical protein